MFRRTRIKMCGMTREKDVELGIELGIDALGFIFFEKSPRNVYPDFVRAIISKLPPFVDCVGVFVDRALEEVEEIIEYCGLSHAQLHGSEDPKYCERLERVAAPCHVVKAFRVGAESSAEQFKPYNDLVHGFLLDTYEEGTVGGTGKSFDWSVIKGLELQRPIILAGGLTADNVKEAIGAVNPFAVDVNSGVEIEPGIKDHASVTQFVQKVRNSDSW